jgi:excisionase family DNA binding protein
MMVGMNERVLKVPEVAERLRVPAATVRRWIREGKLRATLLGGTKTGYRIPESEVARLLEIPGAST